MWKEIQHFRAQNEAVSSAGDRSKELLDKDSSRHTTHGLPLGRDLSQHRRVTTDGSKFDVAQVLAPLRDESEYEGENDFEAMDDEEDKRPHHHNESIVV